MPTRDLYEILGVQRSASEKEIRKAYREAARRNHPDRNPGDAKAEERFKEAAYASDVLLNAEKRKLYDEFGEIGLKEGFDPEAYRYHSRAGGAQHFTSLDELFARANGRGGFGAAGFGAGSFEDLFGAGGAEGLFGRRGRQARRRPPEMQAQIAIEFVEAIRGVERELALQLPGGGRQSLNVRIPAGVTDGGKVRLRGRGPDGSDIVLEVRVRPHRHFERAGNDLLLTLPVTVGEAFRGAKIRLPAPDGPVTLRVPAGVKSGSRLRLRGKGVRRGKEVGDLIVQVQIVLPPAGAKEVEEAIEVLQRGYEGPVREEVEL